MPKHVHEIRDPVHGFIRLETPERKILDSRPFQRLRHIHQLAMTYLVYPGATHKRFEHSLGVMELAGRVFDVITHPDNQTDAARAVIPRTELPYWRRVVRMAALCHDIGHLPFSHAAEELLPAGWDHEVFTDQHVLGDVMKPLWKGINVNAEHVAKLALGPKKFGPKKHRPETFDPWEAILAEIIVGDAFGVDRVDYLLRDSYHAGVAYGKFDHFRLIDTIRILQMPGSDDVGLGIEVGGIHSAEALLLGRYFMYTQLYFHSIRRAYDFHLMEFLKCWLKDGKFSTAAADHLSVTDNDVCAAMAKAAADPASPGHTPARRIEAREHFRLLYSRNPDDQTANPDAASLVAGAAAEKFGPEAVYQFSYTEKSRRFDFPVLANDDRISSAFSASDVLSKLPVVSTDFVFIVPEQRAAARKWLAENRAHIITPAAGASS